MRLPGIRALLYIISARPVLSAVLGVSGANASYDYVGRLLG